MHEGTFGAEGGEKTFYFRHVFHKLFNTYTQSHRLPLQDIFFWFLCNAGIFFFNLCLA